MAGYGLFSCCCLSRSFRLDVYGSASILCSAGQHEALAAAALHKLVVVDTPRHVYIDPVCTNVGAQACEMAQPCSLFCGSIWLEVCEPIFHQAFIVHQQLSLMDGPFDVSHNNTATFMSVACKVSVQSVVAGLGLVL